MNYESRILASINVPYLIIKSIVSSYFITVPQENTRVTVQDEVVTKIR